LAAIIFPENFDFFYGGYPLFSESRLFKKFFPGKISIFSKRELYRG
jgi:hypothetical protein